MCRGTNTKKWHTFDNIVTDKTEPRIKFNASNTNPVQRQL